MTPILAVILTIIVGAAYLLPAILAGIRGHASAWGIFALNLLLGWSGIVWIVALIWALSNKGQSVNQTVIVSNHNNEGYAAAPQPIYVPVPQRVPDQTSLSAPPQTPLLEAEAATCPACAETIKAAAIKCRFCGEQLTPKLITQQQDS